MGKASAAKQDGDRRSRIAAQRAAAQRSQRRSRLLLAGGAIVAVVAVVLAFVLLQGGNGSPGRGGPAGPTGAALTALTNQVTSVPAATQEQVGAGTVTGVPTPISGAPLTSGGKPEMLYMGAEYCPYCAAERWSMIVALSRFGTFSGLTTTRSAARSGAGTAEPYPSTATWTFYKSSYASKYLTFTPVEEFTNVPDKSTGGYTTLMTPTAAQQALIQKYDAANQGAIPFIDYGNRYMSVGASYDPGLLSGLSWSAIAAELHQPSSPVAKGALGAANYMTAVICRLTGDAPATACTPAIRALQAKI